jgi:tetratricopeptide (TPR) repeat protein
MATKRGAREVELDKSPTALGAGVPEALQAVTMKAMATDRERRYARVEELVADLEAYQNGFATRAEDAGAFRKLLLAMQRNKVATVAALVIMVLSAGFVLKITASERRANQSLARLQEAAPIFAEHSQSLIEDAAKNPKALEEALQKIDYAIELDPLNVRYQLLKGGVLQTLRRLDEAEGLYRSVLNANPTNEEAKLNLTVCQAVLAEPKENGALSNSAVRKLARALLEQNRIVESLVLSKASQGAGKEVLDALGAAIKNAGVKTNLPALDTDGTLRLSLNDAGLSRLNFLQGYPIHHLEINHAKTITDFSVLHTLALKTLVIGEHGKTGFNTEFIRGLNLRVLRLPASITDLSPLRGMALEQFQHGYRDKFDGDVGKKGRRERGNQIKGLETLKGMPLRSVRFAAGSMLGALDMLDSGSLESLEIDKCVCESLERLKNLPISKLSIQNLEAPILQDLNFLKDLKSLEKLDASENQSLEDISGLSGLNLKELILDGTAISNFTDLGEMPLEKISAQESRVVDLSGIVGLSKLTQLDLDRTDISDVSPLARLNLNVLSLSGCNRVASVAPLASIKSLREVLLPVLSADVEALRGLSNLKLITYGSGEFATKHADSTKQNPRDFWKMHDLEKQLRAGTPDGRLFPSKFPYMEQRFPGARSFKGRWLYFVRGKFTWHEAEKLARGMGGRLATMGNLDQHRDIRTFLMQGRLLETEGDACWLGNTIDPKTGRWLTPAGTEYIKKMWSGGEPAQEDNMGKKATVLAFANSAKLNASPNTCALSAENKFVVGFLVEWKD